MNQLLTNRDIAGVIIDAAERETGLKIWPENSDALSELLDSFEEDIEQKAFELACRVDSQLAELHTQTHDRCAENDDPALLGLLRTIFVDLHDAIGLLWCADDDDKDVWNAAKAKALTVLRASGAGAVLKS